MNITLLINPLGANTGPFNIYSDVDNYQSLVGVITQTQLIAGTIIAVPDNTTTVLLVSTGICGTSLYISVSNLPTVTPTVTPTQTPTPTVTPTITPSITPTKSIMTSRPLFPSATPSNSSKACLVYGTPVLMADGTSKSIQDVKVGDEILSIPNVEEFFKTNIITPSISTVIGADMLLTHHIVNINNGLLKTSDSHTHVVKRNNTWYLKEAKELQVGDILIDINNCETSISSLELIESPQSVYYISVDKEHVYFANNLLTHNAKQIYICCNAFPGDPNCVSVNVTNNPFWSCTDAGYSNACSPC
jgi:hypothetical protein